MIDGNDIRDVTLKSLRRQIGIVNQEILHQTGESLIIRSSRTVTFKASRKLREKMNEDQ